MLRPGSLQLLGLVVATSFVVATLLVQWFSRVDVATTVSRHDLIVFPFFCILNHDLSFRLRPLFSCHHFSSKSGLLFLVALHIVTSVLGCDHISISTAQVLVCDFLFLVVTSFVVHFPSSGHNLNSLL